MNLIAIAIGASIGAITRYLLLVTFSNQYLAIFIINMVGCLLFGFALATFQIKEVSQQLQLLITVGFLSSITTFSTFSNQLLNLFETNQILQLLLYLITSIIIGCLLILVGKYLILYIYDR